VLPLTLVIYRRNNLSKILVNSDDTVSQTNTSISRTRENKYFSNHSKTSKVLKFPENSIKVSFHPHLFYLKSGYDITLLERSKCLGNLTTNGCKGKAKKTLKYFTCTPCRDIICEKCLVKPRKFKTKNITLHEHKLYFKTKVIMDEWRWRLNFDNWKKQSISHNYGNRIYYSCKTWDFEICLGWCQNSHQDE